MARSLDVYLHTTLVGQLTQDNSGQIGFRYEQQYLDNPSAVAISQSLPLREEPYQRNECRGFFGGVLPDEAQRTVIARNLGISERNDFAMLERIGGECAGAVTFIPRGARLPDEEGGYRAVNESELEGILKELPRRPLLAGEDGVRLSLAGAQSKVAVRISSNGVSIPLGGSPSTHILKPASDRFEGLIENEAFCLGLAKATGIEAVHAELTRAGTTDYLLVERYDRVVAADSQGRTVITRLHQEDFCQALGVPSDQRYQNEGGPSLKQSFELIRRASSVPALDLSALLDAAIFNFLIGDHDAHGKNFSLLYIPAKNGQLRIRLAPLYDLICTAAYPDLSRRMAMKIGGEYDSVKVFPEHFERLAEEGGLSRRLARDRLRILVEVVAREAPRLFETHPNAGDFGHLIVRNCERMQRSL